MISKKDMIIIYLKILKNRLVKIKTEFQFIKNVYIWRHNNKHNEISIANNFHFENVTVGDESYGVLEVYDYGAPNEKLIIGNYVSIGNNVKFLLGGNHQMKTFSTYPLKSKFTDQHFSLDATTNGPIIIEDEVWIGADVLILSGVTIGRGAIIAAGSVVSKNIPPYTVAGGCPAKIIKNRFSPQIIEKLNSVSLIDIEKKDIIENIDFFYEPVEESVDKIVKLKKK